MGNVRGITIELGFDDKTQRKLKAIAKRAGALADELEEIDNAIECPHCGSTDTTVIRANDQPYQVKCNVCVGK